MIVRVGTWNVEGNVQPGAVELLLGLRAHVLLLTEVPPGFELPGYRTTVLRQPSMRPAAPDGQHYAAVSVVDGLELEELKPPPGTSRATSAAARIGGTTFVSTVLPWPNAPAPPYVGAKQADQTVHAVDELEPWLVELAAQGPLVWGGDWNHPLAGSLSGFTRAGHGRIALAHEALGLTAHTRDAWAQAKPNGARCRSVDHLASAGAGQLDKPIDGRPYSTHDAYVAELTDLDIAGAKRSSL